MNEISWAPVFRAYGHNNRTLMLRLPVNRRCVEVRVADSAANIYLGTALVIAAGLDGIRRNLKPGEPVNIDTYEATPAQLAAARHRAPAVDPGRGGRGVRPQRLRPRDPRRRRPPVVHRAQAGRVADLQHGRRPVGEGHLPPAVVARATRTSPPGPPSSSTSTRGTTRASGLQSTPHRRRGPRPPRRMPTSNSPDSAR